MADLGTLSSLGIGSGVLNYDVIDKLKEADENVMVKPMEDKLDLLKKKESALAQFITIGSTVKTDVMDIADGTLFAKVNTSVSGSSVSVDASDGVMPQDFTINVTQLAQNDVYESKGFASPESVITNSDVTLSIGVGGTSVDFTLQAGSTLEDLKNAINDANAGVTASIIDTGIGDNPYKLVLKADETGEDNIIQFDYSQIEDLGLNATTYQSAQFSSDTDVINNSGSTQTFSISVNGNTYSMDVADGATVSDFIDALNNGDLKDANGNSLKVNALFNTDTGRIEFDIQAIGDISIDDSNLLTNINDNTDFTNENRLQTAQDAIFTYNGVEVQRSSNTVDDLITGVTINLNSVGESNVSINNNVDDIVDSIKKFVADYNAMISNLQSLTAFDKDEGTVGLFQGDSDFTMLSSVFSNDIFNTMMSYTSTATDRNGNEYQTKALFSAADVGFSIDRTGMISFDEEKFRETYQKNPDLTQRYFETAFTKVKDDFDRTITGDNSNLSLLSNQIKDEEKSYQDRIDAMNEYLETKYKIMAQQFAAYDEMINSFNAMSQSLNMAIEQAINSKS